MSSDIPKAVLKDALAEAIGSRRVRAAVFTTFTFDPGFFEIHVLPTLFDRTFHQSDKMCRIQAEDALRDVRHGVAVYYDRSGIVGDATSAQLDFRRIAVARKGGVFHPKVALILVENPIDEFDIEAGYQPSQSLVVAALSANLTRSGWWENVETGHVAVIDAPDHSRDTCPFRPDVLKLIREIRASAPADEEHACLDAIQDFVRREAPRRKAVHHSVGGVFRTRLFVGQKPLDAWLRDLRLDRHHWNLEIVSPYFDADNATALRRLMEAMEPRQVRVHLPTDGDGRALVSPDQYASVEESGARWSKIDDGITRPGARANQESVPPRRVHAKVYRFWSKHDGEVVLVGSPNLTMAAHGRAAAGNLEAAFLMDRSHIKGRRWWLNPLQDNPSEFAKELETEDRDSEHVLCDLALRFDWTTGSAAVRVDSDWEHPLSVETPTGLELFTQPRLKAGLWHACGPDASQAIAAVIEATSLLVVRTNGSSWRILVREEGMSHKPSLVDRLTPEEILLYWSLLSPEQREAFLESKLAGESTLEGLAVRRSARFSTTNTLFDRFAGIYHAFERLHKHIAEALNDDRPHDASTRLCGAKYDSLPVLLGKVLERDDGDPIIDYVTFLCGRQVLERVTRHYPDFIHDRTAALSELNALLTKTGDLRRRIPGSPEWLDWYENAFLTEAAQLEEQSS